MKRIRKWVAVVLTLAMVLGTVGSVSAISTNAISTCVMDVDSGRVLYTNNAHEQRPIASITKIMTGLLACEAADKIGLDTMLTCSQHAHDEEGSSLYMEVGDKITYKSCIYATMLRSGNDAAMLLAETVAGSEGKFVKKMNKKARKIGMTETCYGNPNGLVDEGNYSTAYDMCLLGRYAMQNELFAEVVGTWHYVDDQGWDVANHNKLINEDSRCVGIKTGFTSAAGRTLVSCFENPENGQRVVCCTLYDSYDFQDHIRVHEWAFENYPTHTLCEKNKVLTSLTMAETGEVYDLKAAKTLTYAMTDSEARRVFVRVELPDNQVELQEGDKAGTVTYYLDGNEIGRTKLICAPAEAS